MQADRDLCFVHCAHHLEQCSQHLEQCLAQ